MLSNRHTKIKLSRQICTVLKHTTLQKQFYKMVAHMLLSHDLTSEPYTVWCGCCSRAKQTLKWLGSLQQTHSNRIISESVLLSLISDKKDPNFKKMQIFHRSSTTQSHGTWHLSTSLLYSAITWCKSCTHTSKCNFVKMYTDKVVGSLLHRTNK